jgi:mRNA interferase MazF
MANPYIPQKGDLIWIDFDPQSGHEQSGRRPALVISPESYNKKVGLLILCPVTSRIKNYPFEVKIPENHKISGVILSDQVKSLDFQARHAAFCCKAPKETMQEVLGKVSALLGLTGN